MSCAIFSLMQPAVADDPQDERERKPPEALPLQRGERAPSRGSIPPSIPPPPETILRAEVQPIDLGTALRLAGVQNPELMLARQRVVEASALQQLAAAQFLPSINFGLNYDLHNGPIQQSNGNILSLNRSALYVGSGANVVAAGTVHIPGVLLSYNLADVYFTYLASRQNRVAREAMSIAVRNQMFLDVTLAYSELLRAEGHRAISVQARDESREIARLTSEYATTGAGRVADANRAATELAKREANLMGAEGDILRASADSASCSTLTLRFASIRPTLSSCLTRSCRPPCQSPS